MCVAWGNVAPGRREAATPPELHDLPSPFVEQGN